MIIADVNILVFAYRREAPEHDVASRWLTTALAGPDDIGLVDAVLAGFVRIVTNSRVFAEPAPTGRALDFVHALAAAPRSRWIPPGRATWDAFRAIVTADRQVRGNLVPDAYIAAAALANNARVATSDHGFARFAGLDWFDPLTE